MIRDFLKSVIILKYHRFNLDIDKERFFTSICWANGERERAEKTETVTDKPAQRKVTDKPAQRKEQQHY